MPKQVPSLVLPTTFVPRSLPVTSPPAEARVEHGIPFRVDRPGVPPNRAEAHGELVLRGRAQESRRAARADRGTTCRRVAVRQASQAAAGSGTCFVLGGERGSRV